MRKRVPKQLLLLSPFFLLHNIPHSTSSVWYVFICIRKAQADPQPIDAETVDRGLKTRTKNWSARFLRRAVWVQYPLKKTWAKAIAWVAGGTPSLLRELFFIPIKTSLGMRGSGRRREDRGNSWGRCHAPGASPTGFLPIKIE